METKPLRKNLTSCFELEKQNSTKKSDEFVIYSALLQWFWKPNPYEKILLIALGWKRKILGKNLMNF
ncbi:MAG: hypothetical protein F6K40_01275 [Okeania sp. SIO3I5]|uniref:hypothetical protein n=1 Tax=Okeania sp. SIO3I5 TaxID=2607805 RepID=UPI0013B5CF6D|nr:hypothetical protein [Okeania sp. SIO3I5]NEQ35015.1 hypothetical protein [Okeania sp. SIO3I5]